MNAKQDNKLAMYRAVVTLLPASASQISRVPALAAKIATLQSKIDRVLSLAGTQSVPSRGAVATKEQALDAMAETAASIAGATRSYAKERKLRELTSRVTIPLSDLKYGRQQARVVLAQQIHDAAAKVVDQLGDFGVNRGTLDDLKAKIATATEALSAPRGAVTSRKAATQELDPAIEEIDALLLDEIDPLMLSFKTTAPQLYKDYRAARIIIDRPGGRTAKATTVTTITAPAASTKAIPHDSRHRDHCLTAGSLLHTSSLNLI
jgi:hypothetical protein